MDERDRRVLEALVEHAEAAIHYAHEGGREWWRDRRTVDAVLMRISQVGEAASRTSPEALAEIPDVDWKSVKGVRAKIVHDYVELDLLIVRGIVSRQLPKLVSATRRAGRQSNDRGVLSAHRRDREPSVTSAPHRTTAAEAADRHPGTLGVWSRSRSGRTSRSSTGWS